MPNENLYHPYPLLVHTGDIERRISHHKIEFPQRLMWILIVRVCFFDVPRESMHSQVHLAKADGISDTICPIHRDFRGKLLVVLDKPGALDEHAPRPAGRVEDEAMIRLDDFYDQSNKAGWGEKFPSLLSLLHRELSEEILVNLPKGITFDVVRDEERTRISSKSVGLSIR